MFIELTDILRCPEPHAEQFVVLIPGEMTDRSVRTGTLGCPVCQREYPIRDGIVCFAAPPADFPAPGSSLDPVAIQAFLGLGGPGGYVGLVGPGPSVGAALITAMPGVHFIGVNPSPPAAELPRLSLVTAAGIPVKARSLRGVVLWGDFAGDPAWLAEAGRVVLPGLRVVGQGPVPEGAALEVLASAEGWWVAQRQ